MILTLKTRCHFCGLPLFMSLVYFQILHGHTLKTKEV